MPFSRATSRMVWSSRAPTSRPSMVRVLTRTRGLGVMRTPPLSWPFGALAHSRRAAFARDVGVVLLAEIPQGGEHGVGRALAQPAQAGVAHQVAELLEQRQIRGGGLARP